MSLDKVIAFPGATHADPAATANALAAYVPLRRGPPLSTDAACRIVSDMTTELLLMAGDRVSLRRDRRREACHIRQIAMYVCHVILRLPQAEIGRAFGRERSTVSHACFVVEDRRDDRRFDDFVSVLERMAEAIFEEAVGVEYD